MRQLQVAWILIEVMIVSLSAVSRPAESTQSIQWRSWDASAFSEAAKQDKMILVDVGMEGCTACRWMDERTYTNPDVINLINQNFIAIQVDSESRPDIGERYSDWAWPAIIFMSPKAAQMHALRGSRSPENFSDILRELIERKKDGLLTSDNSAPFPAPHKKNDDPLIQIRENLLAQIDNAYDDDKGGWGSIQKSLYSYAQVYQLQIRARTGKGPYPRRALLQTADGLLQQLDPVWGGVFVASIRDWANIVPEKRISNQAAAMYAFAEAYWMTGDKRYLAGAKAIDQYMSRFMQDANGTFYTSQEDDAPGLKGGIDARAYYKLADIERRRYGTPPIDHSVYTGKNGEMISAYVRLFETTRDQRYLKIARRAVDALLKSRMQEAGWMLQAKASKSVDEDKRMRAQDRERRPFLKGQVYFAQALIDLARASGDPIYLKSAKKIADALIKILLDKKFGGFYATVSDAANRFIPLQKPVEDNAVAARFLFELSVYLHDDSYKQAAVKTVRAVSLPSLVEREGRMTANLSVALELLTKGYVEYSVVGEPSDPAALALYEAAAKVYEPRKILHYQAEGRYPKQKQAAVFICNPKICTPALTTPVEIMQQAATF